MYFVNCFINAAAAGLLVRWSQDKAVLQYRSKGQCFGKGLRHFSKMNINQPLLSMRTHVSSNQNILLSILCGITHA